MKKFSVVAVIAVLLTVGVLTFGSGTLLQGAFPRSASMTGTPQVLSTSGNAESINTLTIIDSSTPRITAANDIRIRIPSTVNARWFTLDTTATIINPTTGVVSSTAVYASNQILVLDVTTDFAASESVQISGLGFVGEAASAGAVLEWSFDGGTKYVTGAGSTRLSVNPNDVAATLTLSDPKLGAVSLATLNLTLATPLAATDTITFTAPPELDVSALTPAVTGTLKGTSNIICVAFGQRVVCTIDGASATGSSLTMTMANITIVAVGSTDVNNLVLHDTSLGGASIGKDQTVAMTDTTL